MPGVSGVTVVTTLVCFYLFRIRGCGRVARPAFPAPSYLGGQEIQVKLAQNTRRDREGVAASRTGCLTFESETLHRGRLRAPDAARHPV